MDSDARSVDYDAIAMLNVSATQELARQVTAKELELKELRAANTELAKKLSALEAATAEQLAATEARDHDREARLSRLEAALGAQPPRVVRASLHLH